MKLYWSAPTASLAILVLAYEMELPIELIEVDADSRLMADGRRLSEINPKNCVPVLERDDGSIITEMAVMLGWLAAQDPQMRFTAPADSEEHLRINEWMVYFATEQHKLATLLFWDIDGQAKQAVKARMAERFVLPEKALEKSDFLVGNRFTIADMYLLVMVRGCRHLIEGLDLHTRFPRVHAFAERAAARSAVGRALQDHVHCGALR